MPKFDRSVLARFLPTPRAVADFERLNTTVDVELPTMIDEASSLASQANIAAQQALTRLDDVEARIAAADLAPAAIPAQPLDDLAPAHVAFIQPDDLTPTYHP